MSLDKSIAIIMSFIVVTTASASEECQKFMAEKQIDVQVCEQIDFECVQGLYPRLIKRASSAKALYLAMQICQ